MVKYHKSLLNNINMTIRYRIKCTGVQTAPDAFESRCDPSALEATLLRLMPRTSQVERSSSGEVPVAPDVVAVLKFCEDELRRDDASELRLDHVVHGLIQQSEGVAAAALREVGIESRTDWDDL